MSIDFTVLDATSTWTSKYTRAGRGLWRHVAPYVRGQEKGTSFARRSHRLLVCVWVALAAIAAIKPAPALAEIYISDYEQGIIAEYTNDGELVNPALVSGLGGQGAWCLTASGSTLFVTHYNTVCAYTTSGTVVQAPLITGIETDGLTALGSDLYLADYFNGLIAKYTTSGTLINSSFISGLNLPMGIAVDDNYVYVANWGNGVVGKYTTSGETVNANFITGLGDFASVSSLAVSGDKLFVGNWDTGDVKLFDTSGDLLDANFIPGNGRGVRDLEVLGDRLYVAYFDGTALYTTSGVALNTALITGYPAPLGIAVTTDVPEPTSLSAMLLAGTLLLLRRRRVSRVSPGLASTMPGPG